MGARVYLPTLGRFAQIDPIEGGTENAYAYPTDPVNDMDVSGEWAFLIPIIIHAVRIAAPHIVRAVVKYTAKKVVVATVKKVVKTAVKVVTKAVYVYTRIVKPAVRAVAKTVAKKARAVVKKAKAVTKKAATAVKKTVKAVGKATQKISAPANVALSLVAIGVCLGIAAACLGATVAAVGISAVVTGAQSYAKHDSVSRAIAQTAASALVGGLMSVGFGAISKAAFGASRIGKAAVDMHGVPFSFAAGLSTEAIVDKIYDSAGGN